MLLAKNYEDIEATDPQSYLESRGATVTVVGIDRATIPGKKGGSIEPDTTFDDLPTDAVDRFDLLLIPGGGSPEYLRIHEPALDLTRRFHAAGKPIASICHGPQLLISAGVLPGRRTTSVNRIRDDIRNAGGLYVDEALVVDGNLISSRVPADLPQFNQAMADALGLPR
jgi:protease I